MSRETPLMSCILVTMRPGFLPAICAMLSRQTCAPTELVVVLHGHLVASLAPEERSALETARIVLEMPKERSLGYCLNAAICEARGTFVAKIDDDDLYGRRYLEEAMGHLLAGDGDIVGKSECFVYLEQDGSIILRRAGLSRNERRYVAGGTLGCSRALALKHPFRDLTLREDIEFLNDCRAGGATVYSTSRRNFMYFRRAGTGGHTWIMPDSEFRESGIVVGRRPDATRDELLAMIEKAGR